MSAALFRLDPRTVAGILDRAVGRRILVVGDCMLDRYLSGTVTRVSPEAPVPVVRVEEEREALGGAANVAAGVAALGGRPRLLGVVGDDPAGRALRRRLEEEGIDAGGLVVDGERPTTVKSRVMGRGQQMLRFDREREDPLREPVRKALRDRALAELGEADALLLVDYDKGVLEGPLGPELLEASEERRVPSVVDPKLRRFFALRGAFVFKPNGRELAAALGRKDPPAEPFELESVRRRVACRHLLVTLGEEGMLLVGAASGPPCKIPSRAREVFDVTGAGDTVTAVLGVALAAEARVETAAALANFAAGLEVSHRGAVAVARAEVEGALARAGGEAVGGADVGAKMPAGEGVPERTGTEGGSTG